VAILFGANASGKSNILRAFGTMRQMVLNSVRLNPDDTLDEYEPFLLDEESRNNNTEFEAEFTIRGEGGIEQLYRYGFAFSESLIMEEWLYRHEKSNEIELFYRDRNKVQVNEIAFPEGKGKEDTLNSNRLFLSLIAQLNGIQSKDIISVLKDAEIEVSNHMSMLTEEGLAKLDSVFKKVKKEQPKAKRGDI